MITDVFRDTGGTHQYLDLDDITLYYEVYGEGYPLFLLHGGLVDHRTWHQQIPEFSRHFQVIAPDTRAHGRSTDADKPLGYRLFALDWFKLLQHLDIEKAHFVGWSDGGCTALVMGMEYPQVVNKLVAIGTPYNVSNYKPGRVEFFAQATPEMLEAAYGQLGTEIRQAYQAVASEPDRWASFFQKLVNDMFTREPDFTLDQLKAIEAATLVIHGGEEESFDLKHCQDMVNAIPRGTLIEIPDGTHFAPLLKPHEVNQAVLDFLLIQ